MSNPERGSEKRPTENETWTEEQNEAAFQILRRISPLLGEGDEVEDMQVWTWANLVARSDNHPESVRVQINFWLNNARMRGTLSGIRGEATGQVKVIAEMLKQRSMGKPHHFWQPEVMSLIESFVRLEKKTRTATWKKVDFWTLRSKSGMKFVAMAGWMMQEGVESWKVVIKEVLEDYRERPGDYLDVKFAYIYGGDMVKQEGVDVVTDEEISRILADLIVRREAGKNPFGAGWSNPK